MMYVLIAITIVLITVIIWQFLIVSVDPAPIKQKLYQDTSKKQYYKLLDNIIKNKSQTISNLKKAGQLYLNGIPDRYDITGKKHLGIKPNIVKSIEYFKKAARLGDNQSLLSIAKIYHYGLGNTVENLPVAERYYQYIANDPELKAEINNNLLNLRQTLSNDQIYNWLNLPNPRHNIGLPGAKPSRPSRPSRSPLPAKISINKIYRANTIKKQAQKAHEPQIPIVPNDMHNVHDHAVIASIIKSYNNLETSTTLDIPKHLALHEVRKFLHMYLHNDKLSDAIKALDSIERNHIPLAVLDATDSDVLCLVWNRINSDRFNEETMKSLKENLADELSEIIEHGTPCCLTGRFTRILDSLNVVDKAVTIKSTHMITDEMMNTASKIRDKILGEANQEDKQLYLDGEDVPELENKIHDSIINKLTEDYVMTDILTQETFDNNISKWISMI